MALVGLEMKPFLDPPKMATGATALWGPDSERFPSCPHRSGQPATQRYCLLAYHIGQGQWKEEPQRPKGRSVEFASVPQELGSAHGARNVAVHLSVGSRNGDEILRVSRSTLIDPSVSNPKEVRSPIYEQRGRVPLG